MGRCVESDGMLSLLMWTYGAWSRQRDDLAWNVIETGTAFPWDHGCRAPALCLSQGPNLCAVNSSIRVQEELFWQALALPATEWEPFLRQQCSSDVEMRRQLESLLRAAQESCGFLERPAVWDGMHSGPPAREETAVGSWIGNYRIAELIGEGGWAVVYRAEQVRPVRRSVALKVLRPGMGSREVMARFEAERQALALMDHPNIARVFDAGSTASGLPYFVMELIHGMSITRYCDERVMGVPARLGLFVQVCRALHHAHEKGVVHRDIKPSNVLVAEYDGVAVPKVIDFGIVKALQAPLTAAPLHTSITQVIGTPIYMSPEQADLRLAAIDRRTDVYGLGILLHELLVGVTPVDARDLDVIGIEGLRRRICGAAALPPSARFSALGGVAIERRAQRCGTDARGLIAALSGALDAIVLRCLRREPDARYGTADALAADILRHLAGQATEAAIPAARRYEPGPFASASTGHGAGMESRSVAVLPFVERGGAASGGACAERMHEDVIMHLAKVRGLRVISRASVADMMGDRRDLAAIGAALGVGHVLEGRIRQSGDRVQVTVQLTEVRTRRVAWAETFDRDAAEVFALPSALARQIAGALRVSLTARERRFIDRAPTANQAAYAAFLRGRALGSRSYNREDLTGAVDALEEAVALDPQFALAWAHLSMAHGAMYWFTFLDPTPERLARCKAAVDEALRVQPDLPEAHLTLALYHYRGFRDWQSAWRELEEAHASMRGDADVLCARGLTLRRMGRWEESTQAFTDAVAVDPRNGQAWLGLVDNYGFHRRFEAALSASRHVLAFAPDHRLAGRHACWYQFALDGDRAALLERLGRMAGGDGGAVRDRYDLALLQADWGGALRVLDEAPMRSFRDQKREVAKSELRALALLLAGDRTQARVHADQAARFYAQSALQREPEQVFTTMSLARALAMQGRAEDALAVGRRAMDLLPIARDALWGPEIIGEYAALCLLLGEVDEALVHLCDLLRHPWDVSANELRFDPIWRRLAGDARFEAIVALANPVGP